MRYDWRPVPDFPDYVVNQFGEIINATTDRPRKYSYLASGHAKISLYQDGRLLTRSVAPLVATAFLEEPPEYYDTVIHLNGNLKDCSADNLMWRPRWFAIKFQRQFSLPNFYDGYTNPIEIVELNSGRIYNSIAEVCMKEGVYYFDVQKSILEETFTPVTGQQFRYA